MVRRAIGIKGEITEIVTKSEDLKKYTFRDIV